MADKIVRPLLTTVRPIGGQAGKAVVLVHGILSSHHTFQAMQSAVEQDPGLAEWGIGYFDYDFWQAMPDSANQLGSALIEQFGGKAKELTLVCHSMGGLIGRLAILSVGDKMPFLKRLVMLGTPN